jgi:hypothetical protein
VRDVSFFYFGVGCLPARASACYRHMRVVIDDPEPCEVCGKPAVTVVVDGNDRRLCRDYLPLDAEGAEPQSGGTAARLSDPIHRLRWVKASAPFDQLISR